MNFTAAIESQRAFFQTGGTRSLEFRRAQLLKFRDAIQSREKLFLNALHADLRKSPHEAYTSEVGLVINEIDYALHHLASWLKTKGRRSPLLAWPARAFVRPEPYGIALIIGPWNYPFQLVLSPLVGAIAAGNCAVIKTSEFAPHTADAIQDLILATFASNFVTVIQGERDVSEALLREKFNTIFFTGSSAVGRAVMTAAAKHLTPVTLELGGKSPCVVCADAPLKTTARRIVWGKFMNAGQTCVAPDFLMVARQIRAPLIAELKSALVEFYGENPQRSPDYGRIVNQHHFDRLVSYLAKASILHGGQSERSDLYLAPTITEPTGDGAEPLMQEEIFGPILPVLEFDKLEDALTKLRDRPTPLALYLFTKDPATQERVLLETRSGGVCINDSVTHMISPTMPFGGLGESGMGAYHGRASFDSFTHQRTVLRRSFLFDSKLRYSPPRISLAMLKRACRFLLGG